MTVKYYHEMKGFSDGNVIWSDDRDNHGFRMRDGKFSRTHPAAPGDGSCDDKMQFGKSAALAAFRALGYWASCFPEGDGVCFKSDSEKTAIQVAADIVVCFGWVVTIMRDEKGKNYAWLR